MKNFEDYKELKAFIVNSVEQMANKPSKTDPGWLKRLRQVTGRFSFRPIFDETVDEDGEKRHSLSCILFPSGFWRIDDGFMYNWANFVEQSRRWVDYPPYIAVGGSASINRTPVCMLTSILYELIKHDVPKTYEKLLHTRLCEQSSCSFVSSKTLADFFDEDDLGEVFLPKGGGLKYVDEVAVLNCGMRYSGSDGLIYKIEPVKYDDLDEGILSNLEKIVGGEPNRVIGRSELAGSGHRALVKMDTDTVFKIVFAFYQHFLEGTSTGDFGSIRSALHSAKDTRKSWREVIYELRPLFQEPEILEHQIVPYVRSMIDRKFSYYSRFRVIVRCPDCVEDLFPYAAAGDRRWWLKDIVSVHVRLNPLKRMFNKDKMGSRENETMMAHTLIIDPTYKHLNLKTISREVAALEEIFQNLSAMNAPNMKRVCLLIPPERLGRPAALAGVAKLTESDVEEVIELNSDLISTVESWCERLNIDFFFSLPFIMMYCEAEWMLLDSSGKCFNVMSSNFKNGDNSRKGAESFYLKLTDTMISMSNS